MTKPLPPGVVRNKGGRPPGSTVYPGHIIDQALLTMAYTRQAKAAWDQMKLAGVKPLPSQNTMREWRHKYAGRLAELTEKHGAEIERLVISDYRDIVTKATSVSDLGIEKTRDGLEDGTLRDPAKAAKDMALIAAIYTDKILLYQGKPTKIIGREKDAEESLRSLANRFAVDSSAQSDDDPKEIEA